MGDFYAAQRAREKKIREEAIRRLIPFSKNLVAYLKQEGHKITTAPKVLGWRFDTNTRITWVKTIDDVEVATDVSIDLRSGDGYRASLIGDMFIRISDPQGYNRHGRSKTKSFREPKSGYVAERIAKALLDYVQWKREYIEATTKKDKREKAAKKTFVAAEKAIKPYDSESIFLDEFSPEHVAFRVYVTPEQAGKLAKAYMLAKADG